MAEKKTTKVSKIIEDIETLSVLELSELVKSLEDKFGPAQLVSVSSPVAGSTAGASAVSTEGAEEGQTTFNVILANPGTNKISVIKTVREINQTLGLKEAKDLVESTPKEILNGVNKANAEEAKKKLEAVGATVELK